MTDIEQLRERAEASIHYWQRILEDTEKLMTPAAIQNARDQIVWLRGYLRALDEVLTPESK